MKNEVTKICNEQLTFDWSDFMVFMVEISASLYTPPLRRAGPMERFDNHSKIHTREAYSKE